MEVTALLTATRREGDLAEIAERLAGMRAKESSPYEVPDYHGGDDDDLSLSISSYASSDDVRAPHDGSGGDGGHLRAAKSSSSRAIHRAWRERICKWCYQVVDTYGE